MSSDSLPDTQVSDGQSQPESFSDQLRTELVSGIGGIRGIIETSVPVIIFIIANVLWTLRTALIAAVAVAVAIAAWKLLTGASPKQALNGLVGVVFAAIVAAYTGKAQNFYLPGIVFSAFYTLVLAGSLVVRRPVVGYISSKLMSLDRWRHDQVLYRFFFRLTALWVMVFTVKVGLQVWLYLAGASANTLGIARLVLGTPPAILLLIVTVVLVRRFVYVYKAQTTE